MVQQSVFRNIISFFGDIGIYDVVLPFLLVFTIVFAMLDKTKILGVDIIHGHKISKKNLNALTAFVIAFLVIASTRLVALINEAMANIVVLLLLSFGFLLLIGSFFKEGDPVFLEGPYRTAFMGIMFFGIILIFLHAVRTSDGESFLEVFWGFLLGNWRQEWVASIIFIVLVIGFIAFIVKDPHPGHPQGGDSSGHMGPPK
jgi:hypothetical protein